MYNAEKKTLTHTDADALGMDAELTMNGSHLFASQHTHCQKRLQTLQRLASDAELVSHSFRRVTANAALGE